MTDDEEDRGTPPARMSGSCAQCVKLMADVSAELASLREAVRIYMGRIDDMEGQLKKQEAVINRAIGAKSVVWVVLGAIGALIVKALDWVGPAGH